MFYRRRSINAVIFSDHGHQNTGDEKQQGKHEAHDHFLDENSITRQFSDIMTIIYHERPSFWNAHSLNIQHGHEQDESGDNNCQYGNDDKETSIADVLRI